MGKLEILLESITTQFGFKEFCTQTRLYTYYLSMLFNDMIGIYMVQNAVINKLVSKFSDLNAKKRADAFQSYEKFLDFTKEFKIMSKSLPILLNTEFEIPELYKENHDTTLKLKKLMKGNKAKQHQNDENFDFWEEEDKQENLSEEYNFDQL